MSQNNEQSGEEKYNLTKEHSDIIGEVCNISMGSAATALSNIMGKKVTITSPHVEVGTEQSIKQIEKIPSVGVVISYTQGIIGKNILIIRRADAEEIVKVMMGGEVPEEDFGEIHMSAIGEVMNQMMGSSATALSDFIDRPVNISPPSAFVLTEDNKKEKLQFIYDRINNIILVRFIFRVEDLIESEIYMIMAPEFSEELVKAMLKNMNVESGVAASPAQEQAPQPQPAAAAAPRPTAPQQAGRPAAAPAVPETPAAQAAAAATPQQVFQPPASPAAVPPVSPVMRPAAPKPQVKTVRPVNLPSFVPEPQINQNEQQNFELIQKVPLELSVVVGRARKLVKEVLDLSVGSIVELDKQAGDPVDIIVNGQLIAYGEVVVIDESFGVRVTEILNKSKEE